MKLKELRNAKILSAAGAREWAMESSLQDSHKTLLSERDHDDQLRTSLPVLAYNATRALQGVSDTAFGVYFFSFYIKAAKKSSKTDIYVGER